MVYRNQCGDAFFIGNMKNRTLQGSEIFEMNSQESDVLDKSPENNADEMASDIDEVNFYCRLNRQKRQFFTIHYPIASGSRYVCFIVTKCDRDDQRIILAFHIK